MTSDVPLARALGWVGMGVVGGLIAGLVLFSLFVDWMGKRVK